MSLYDRETALEVFPLKYTPIISRSLLLEFGGYFQILKVDGFNQL